MTKTQMVDHNGDVFQNLSINDQEFEMMKTWQLFFFSNSIE